MLAAVLAAQANGKEVTFLGRDRCHLRGDMETVDQVHLVPLVLVKGRATVWLRLPQTGDGSGVSAGQDCSGY